jgi:uncharacterized lipoprotein YbaY
VRRSALVVVSVLAALGLAACGGSSKPSTTPHSKTTVVNPAVEKAQIKSAYEKFFAGNTSLSDRVALLQNGEQFKPVIQAFASIPLAKNVSASVSSVTLQGKNNAKVVYQVKFAGSALPKQTGTAVRESGTWKVGDASLCKLVSLSGSTPPACKS